jgi:YD repeat-containing protein
MIKECNMSCTRRVKRRVRPFILLLAGCLFLDACATAPRPVSCPLPGREVETLFSPISVAVKTEEQGIGGRGYLIYRRPDRFHLVILSPFGQTLFEVFLNGDRITCLVPSKNTAYTGTLADIPDRGAMRSWGLMGWVAERPPATGPVPGTRECATTDGRSQLVTYDERGLVSEKEDREGNRVVYQDYAEVNGVAIPTVVDLTNRRGESVRIAFTEPAVNEPVEEKVLTPSLEGLTVLPLQSFQEM